MPNSLDFEYRDLLDAAPDGIVVVSAEGVIVLVNRQAEALFGYPRDEMVDQRVELLIPGRYRADHPKHIEVYTREPHTRPMGSGLELFGRRKDGSEFPVEISLSPLETSRGKLVSAAIRDVTDRKRIEAEARRANAFLLSAVDSIHDAFVLYDEEDRVVLVNSSFRELLGRSLSGPVVGRLFEEVVERALADNVFELGDETAAQLRDRWLAYHRLPSGAFEVRTRTGHTLRVVDRPTAEHGTVSLMLDMTEERMRADELRRARETAEAASHAKSEFLASMSHELRTPLNAVLGFAQLLQRDKKQPLSERQLERIDHVLRGGEHLLKLIDEVLDLSRIEAGGVTISAEPVTVPEVLAEVQSTLEPMAQRAGITVVIARLPALPAVIADRTRLAQILMNFGSNAIKYNRPGGSVRFEAITRADVVRVSVIDDGIGIPEDKRGKIFEPFQRAGQETGPIQGTGIGLAISKRLAELMKGQVGFTSESGCGSVFWVEMPVDRISAVEAAAPVATTSAQSTLVTAVPRHKVVYVEDNPSNIAFMRELMDDLPGIELLTAPTAEIGIELVRVHQPALVIMDINLPGMSGFDATKQLAAWPETKHIPVVALTAAALGRDVSRGQDAGFYRYLTKPVKVDELTAVLEQLLAAT
ncbi:MAG TPA: PAS domain S-box protein [Kofleriaceae bacterium]|nr:PAS domain S-box protein [Kofleriaceae bacterium]